MPTQSSLHSQVRDPDGIPHAIVGLTSLGSFALAMALLVALTTDISASATAVVLVLLAIPALVFGLHGMSHRARARRY
ncbi:MAG: hypothetical protein JWO36_1598 [Myxococcales bacterium]|nr:hypothetical protein [Myxococcales bacterium]